MKVSDLMTTEVVTTTPTASLKEVARALVEHGITGMPVCDEAGEVVGVISEGDILHMDIPESDAKWLLPKGAITAEEKDVLMELIRVRRKEDRYWGL